MFKQEVPPTTPVDASDRLHALDIVRGFALFGMILVHCRQKMRLPASCVEDLIGWGVWVLVEQKAWGTSAFLFGVLRNRPPLMTALARRTQRTHTGDGVSLRRRRPQRGRRRERSSRE